MAKLVKTMADKKILIIDDSEFTVRNLSHRLKKKYQVISAGTGKEGISMLAQFKPDLLIMELKIRDVPGVQLLHIFKKHNISLPTFITTEIKDKETHEQAIKAGAVKVFTKPYNLNDLLNEIDSFLEHKPYSEERVEALKKTLDALDEELKNGN